MKIQKIIFGLAIATTLASCSSDDSNTGGSKEDKIIGKWYYNSYVINGVKIPYEDHEDCGKDYVLFLENGIMTDVDVWDCQEYTYNYTYTISGNTITTTYLNDEPETGKIITLTSKKLVVESYVDELNGKLRTEFTRN